MTRRLCGAAGWRRTAYMYVGRYVCRYVYVTYIHAYLLADTK